MTEFFNKEVYNQTDILSLIETSAEESIHMDFKAAGSLGNQNDKKSEISKDVSSFANSDGGMIIYGLTEEDHVAHSTSFIDGNQYTKEWLEQVIQSRIQRNIPNLKIHPVRFDNDLVQSIYVVKIPKSPFAPHQASDSRFYKRYNFQSVRMNEYEVRDVYNRRYQTNLHIDELLFNRRSGIFMAGTQIRHIDYLLRFQIKNLGNSIEERYKLEINLPKQIYTNYNHPNPIRDYLIRDTGEIMTFSVPNTSPIFQNEITTIIEAGIRLSRNEYPLLSNPGISTKLYYSNGTDERTFDLTEILQHDGRSIRKATWL